MNNIKNYRERELVMYIIACLLVYICFDGKLFEFGTADKIVIISNLLGSTLMMGAISIFAFISDSLFSNRIKDIILSIFGLIKKPGYTIFERIEKNNKDDRYSKTEALHKYSDIYANIHVSKKSTGLYQNREWNKIYSKYRDVSMISVSNRDYLLCRDIFFSTIIIGVIYAIAVLIKVLDFNFKYILFLVIALIITFFATHLKARRFVGNVIAYDILREDE